MKFYSISLQILSQSSKTTLSLPVALVVAMLLVQTSCEKSSNGDPHTDTASESTKLSQVHIHNNDTDHLTEEVKKAPADLASKDDVDISPIETVSLEEQGTVPGISEDMLPNESKEDVPSISEWRTTRRITEMTDTGISAIPADVAVTVENVGDGKVQVKYKNVTLIAEAGSVHQIEVKSDGVESDVSLVSAVPANTAHAGSEIKAASANVSIAKMQQDLAVRRSELQSATSAHSATLSTYSLKLSQLQRDLRESQRRDRVAKENGRTLAKSGKSNETRELEAKVGEAESFIANFKHQHHEQMTERQKEVAILEAKLSATQVEEMLMRKELMEKESRRVEN